MRWVLIAVLLAVASVASGQRTPPSAEIILRPGWKLVLLEYPEPPEYERWWHEIADCEGLPLPPEHLNVRYFAVNGREFVIPDIYYWVRGLANWAIGYSLPEKGEMYLAFPYLDEEYLFKHEAVHFLQFWAGEQAGHPVSRIGVDGIGKCGIVPYRIPVRDDK